MTQSHDKETDPITSGNRMTNDDIAGRDGSNTAKPKVKHDTDKSVDSKDKSADLPEHLEGDANEKPASDEAPDLSHASDDASDVTPSDDNH